MRNFPHLYPQGLAFVAAIALIMAADPGHAASSKDKTKTPAVRWEEGRPGCTFSRGDDGFYRYGLSYEDLAIIVALDSQELEKVRRRHERFFAVMLNVRYKGRDEAELGVDQTTLQFLNHFQVIQTSLDPDNFSQKIQNDADELNHETARAVEKHPEEKESKEAAMRAFLKDSAELQEFLGKNSLRETNLTPGNPQASGWILFSARSKWIGPWKKQEGFILRVPVGKKIFEFPFKLPPKPGEVLLRRRE